MYQEDIINNLKADTLVEENVDTLNDHITETIGNSAQQHCLQRKVKK